MEKIKFIDLFSGIGGFHLGLHKTGMKCVFACEKDKFARLTYQKNFQKISPQLFPNYFNEDIREVKPESIPDYDVLCAGFPCQPFSQAGQKRGFSETKASRGNMFFEIIRIVEPTMPKVLLLENVRHLIKHDEGKTFETIRSTLSKIGYNLYWKVIKASDHGLPQHRPRVYIVCFRKDLNINDFDFPRKRALHLTMDDIFKGKCNKKIGYTLRVGGRSSGLHDRRNWDTYLVNDQVKKVSSIEGAKMMGLPENFVFPVSETQAMKQLGNGVAVNIVEDIGHAILSSLNADKIMGKSHYNYTPKRALELR